jgi:2-polyprenyl-6-methoxyphenol hydroxylase-like FAD-dependent oxidoreductase
MWHSRRYERDFSALQNTENFHWTNSHIFRPKPTFALYSCRDRGLQIAFGGRRVTSVAPATRRSSLTLRQEYFSAHLEQALDVLNAQAAVVRELELRAPASHS